MTRKYQTTHKGACAFLSGPTFRKAFFAWIVTMKIDFRQKENVDPWCGYDPPTLACDGTHLGIAAKQLKLEKPCTSPDVDPGTPQLNAVHMSCDRLLIKDKDIREYLGFLSKKVLYPNTQVPEMYKNHQFYVTNLLRYIQKYPKVSQMMTVLIDEGANVELRATVAKIFWLLSSSVRSSLSAVFPTRYHLHLKEVCNQFKDGRGSGTLLEEVRFYLQEGADLLSICQDMGIIDMGADFLLELVQLTEKVHAGDRNTPPAVPQPGTYNPPSGTAYYFSEHGCQVRKKPFYKIDKDGEDKEEADVDQHGLCRKNYPKVSLGGYGYMFLYFCPEHGSCYGFHLVEGGEGRKDAFSPIFKYKETPPKDIFYDNACQFSQYSLNREPDFWKMVRIFHDIFHSFNHICGDVFLSTRVRGLNVNTEICEQFNSFIQCVKYSSVKMTQAHFMLYLQFMVYVWNKKKQASHKGELRVATAGLRSAGRV